MRIFQWPMAIYFAACAAFVVADDDATDVVVRDGLLLNAQNYTNTFRTTDIDLQQRGCDYVDAFNRLRQMHPHDSIYAVIKGISIDDIIDMSAMGQKSLVMITYGKYGVPKTKVANVEDIEELGVRGVSVSPVHVYFPSSTDPTPHDHNHIHDVNDTPNHQRIPNVHIHQRAGSYHHPHTDCDNCDDLDPDPERSRYSVPPAPAM